MKKMSLGIVILICAGALLTGCGGSKPGAQTEGGDQEIKGDVNEMSQKALRLEKENHDLKKEIFELKRKLGMPIED